MEEKGFLKTGNKVLCCGCESCAQICPNQAIAMKEDKEGFRYPVVNKIKCVSCGLCNQVCPSENMPKRNTGGKYTFGGYAKDESVRKRSTSGGAFSVIADTWCDNNDIIFGAAADGLEVYHSYITDKKAIDKFRKSKYSQSQVGSAYLDVKKFLEAGKKVLFSGTPCQIAGLTAFLKNADKTNLLTIEVICEGVPSPWYMRKYNEWCMKKYKAPIKKLDYRYKDGRKWDFEVMETLLENDKESSMRKDRWFNPFWSIWLNHLMSRPSCYHCSFATGERGADITLGDLWGVHLYCPELYGRNSGTSLIVCNSKKGYEALLKAKTKLYGHKLDFESALKYQSPMRMPIDENPDRNIFMRDLIGDMPYNAINKKWAKRPTVKILWQKYFWGNRQKVALWNIKNSCKES